MLYRKTEKQALNLIYNLYLTKNNIMKQFIVTIEVDENKIQAIDRDISSIEELVEREFGWLTESGIYLENINEITS